MGQIHAPPSPPPWVQPPCTPRKGFGSLNTGRAKHAGTSPHAQCTSRSGTTRRWEARRGLGPWRSCSKAEASDLTTSSTKVAASWRMAWPPSHTHLSLWWERLRRQATILPPPHPRVLTLALAPTPASAPASPKLQFTGNAYFASSGMRPKGL